MTMTFRDQAIVLKVTPIKDTDRRYTIYSKTHGKINLLAKGTRKGRSKMSPHMGWFGSVDIMVARGKFFDRLAGASLQKPYSGILESLSKTSVAQGFLMTIDSLTRPEQPDNRIFSLIEEFLEALEKTTLLKSPDGRGPIFDAALLKLLDVIGFGPELDHCIHCRGPVNVSVAMNFLQGGLECSSCRRPDSLPLMTETVNRLRRFRTNKLIDSAQEPPPYQAASRVIETLLVGHVEERYTALNFMRRVVV